jgi:hypothetical protein
MVMKRIVYGCKMALYGIVEWLGLCMEEGCAEHTEKVEFIGITE